jgi:hypothetical protein
VDGEDGAAGLNGTMGTRGPIGETGPAGVPGEDGVSPFSYGGMFVEDSFGSCFTANPHTHDCNCPSGFATQLMLITNGADFDDGQRFMYLCY